MSRIASERRADSRATLTCQSPTPSAAMMPSASSVVTNTPP
jgi:hypothetical protein